MPPKIVSIVPIVLYEHLALDFVPSSIRRGGGGICGGD
jgi:hypothetical protein